MFRLLLMLPILAAVPVAAVSQPAGEDDTRDDTIVIEGKRYKADQKICKSTEPPTGTRMGPRRICRTAAEWKIAENHSQRMIERHQQQQQAIQAYEANEKNGLGNQGPP